MDRWTRTPRSGPWLRQAAPPSHSQPRPGSPGIPGQAFRIEEKTDPTSDQPRRRDVITFREHYRDLGPHQIRLFGEPVASAAVRAVPDKGNLCWMSGLRWPSLDARCRVLSGPSAREVILFFYGPADAAQMLPEGV